MASRIFVLVSVLVMGPTVWAEEGATPESVLVRNAVVGSIKVDHSATVTPSDQTPPAGVVVVPRQEIGDMTLTPSALNQLRGLVRGSSGSRRSSARRSNGSAAWKALTGRVGELEKSAKDLSGKVTALEGAVKNPETGLAAIGQKVADHDSALETSAKGFAAINKKVAGLDKQLKKKGVPGGATGVVIGLGSLGLIGLLGLTGLFGLLGVRSGNQAKKTAAAATRWADDLADAFNAEINGLRKQLYDRGVLERPEPEEETGANGGAGGGPGAVIGAPREPAAAPV